MAKEQLIIEEDDFLVRVFISEREKVNSIPLYEYIILKCREIGIAGATAIRGIMGYGADRRLHTSKLVDLSDNLPIISYYDVTNEDLKTVKCAKASCATD